MRVLVTGASGFIAAQIVTDLLAKGHEVICCARNTAYTQTLFPQCKVLPCDFIRDTRPEIWLPRLENIDVVVNCVGVFHHPRSSIVMAIHYHTPKALFEAAMQAGVQKIIQISALGVDKSAVLYAQSKKAADDYLLSLPIPSVILRPSVVYGHGSYGGSSLFRGLAGFPFLMPLPGEGKQVFQPICLNDLSKAVLALVEKPRRESLVLSAVSSRKVSLKDILIKMRAWLGFAKVKTISVPLFFIRIASLAGDLIPYSALNTVAYKMMSQDSITSDEESKRFEEEIGFTPKNYPEGLRTEPSTVQDHWHARLFFLKQPLRLSIAFVFVWTAICSLFFYPEYASRALLAEAGITSSFWQSVLFYGACYWDGFLGLAMLFNWRFAKVAWAQIATIVFYTLFISWKLPGQWLEPFAPLAKNLPLLMAILVSLALESDR